MIHALIILLLQVPTLDQLRFSDIPGDLIFSTGSKTYVRIKPNGEVVIPEGVTMDEASRVFWKAVSQNWPSMCRCPNDPLPTPMYTPTMTPYPFPVGGR